MNKHNISDLIPGKYYYVKIEGRDWEIMMFITTSNVPGFLQCGLELKYSCNAMQYIDHQPIPMPTPVYMEISDEKLKQFYEDH